jgi:hypothetical protein
VEQKITIVCMFLKIVSTALLIFKNMLAASDVLILDVLQTLKALIDI